MDKNKVFLINRGELDERLDVEYYLPKHFELLAKLSASRYPLKLLKDISKKIVDGPFGSSVKADDYVENGIPFLRVADITHGDGSIELDDLIYISPEKHKEISRSTIFPNDVVIAKTGATMGAASVVPETIKEANIRGDLAAVMVNDEAFANYIVNFINTKIGQDLFWRLNSGATRGRVVISNLKKYPVLVPDNQKIVEINEVVKAGKIRKNEKEAEAAALLASIDGYLLQTLGITLPSPSEKKAFFYTRFSKVSGGRFDAFYHQSEFECLDTALQSAPASVSTLGCLTVDLKNGAEFRNYSDEGYRYLRVTDLSTHGISDKNMRFVSVEKIPERLKLNRDCILISRSGSLGLVNVVTEEIMNSILSSHIFKVQLNTRLVLPSYLESYLRSSLGQKQIFRNNNGGVIPELNQSALRSIKISLPSIEKQTEIASHINQIRASAKRLQQKAQAELEQAKQQVEKMILGEH